MLPADSNRLFNIYANSRAALWIVEKQANRRNAPGRVSVRRKSSKWGKKRKKKETRRTLCSRNLANGRRSWLVECLIDGLREAIEYRVASTCYKFSAVSSVVFWGKRSRCDIFQAYRRSLFPPSSIPVRTVRVKIVIEVREKR